MVYLTILVWRASWLIGWLGFSGVGVCGFFLWPVSFASSDTFVFHISVLLIWRLPFGIFARCVLTDVNELPQILLSKRVTSLLHFQLIAFPSMALLVVVFPFSVLTIPPCLSWPGGFCDCMPWLLPHAPLRDSALSWYQVVSFCVTWGGPLWFCLSTGMWTSFDWILAFSSDYGKFLSIL